MDNIYLKIGEENTALIFNKSCSQFINEHNNEQYIYIIDENVYQLHQPLFINVNKIIVPSGEINKQLTTVEKIIQELLNYNADRGSTIVGIGGGCLLDMAAFIANIYMRGVSFIAFPTTILSMVDASIGGKNGIDFGIYKNILGVIKQPNCIYYDYDFLTTLPHEEWVNGFAEIIKHACIADKDLFKNLQQNDISIYKNCGEKLESLIYKNAQIKLHIVSKDVSEQNIRKYLNYGHTFGHAIENLCNISHGNAVAIGINIVNQLNNNISESARIDIEKLLKQYELPTHINFDWNVAVDNIFKDKKKKGNDISIILIDNIGEPYIQNFPINSLKK